MAMNKLENLFAQRENWKKLRRILTDDSLEDGEALVAVVRELCVMVCEAALEDKGEEIKKARHAAN